MRAFVVTGPNEGEVRDIAIPTPGAGEALVRVEYVGICGTDYHIFQGDLPLPYPLVCGHEYSGTIVALGSGVGDWREGDRVTVDPSGYCGRCYYCLRRQANHCLNRGPLGAGMHGAFAEYARASVRMIYRVEEHESLDEAAFTEPLACVVYGIERLRVRPSDRALVIGAGPIGLLMAQMLGLSGASDVVVVDVAEEKLKVAHEMGARATFRASERLPAELDERSEKRGFDIVVDCTGLAAVIQGLFAFAAPNARIMFFGVASPNTEITIRPYDVYHMDWEILGSMAINYTFQQARDLLSAGRVSVRPLITSVARLEDMPTIMAREKSATELKTLITPNAP